VYGDVVTRVREPAADFLVVSLDPAVLADDAPRSDEGNLDLTIFSDGTTGREQPVRRIGSELLTIRL
jgi:hypothetical protein